jgi:hypothetical protein
MSCPALRSTGLPCNNRSRGDCGLYCGLHRAEYLEQELRPIRRARRRAAAHPYAHPAPVQIPHVDPLEFLTPKEQAAYKDIERKIQDHGGTIGARGVPGFHQRATLFMAWQDFFRKHQAETLTGLLQSKLMPYYRRFKWMLIPDGPHAMLQVQW